MISKLLGKKTLVIYLSVLMLGTLLAGYLTDVTFAAFQFSLPSNLQMSHHGHQDLTWLEIGTAIALLALSGYHFAVPWIRKVTAPKGNDMIELTVNDMTCGHCAQTIETAVGSILGVKTVHATPDNKKVRINADINVKQDIVTAIKEAGYHPTGGDVH